MATPGKVTSRAALLISGMTLCMLVPLVFWYARSPDTFFSEVIGLNGISSVQLWVWVLTGVIVVIYVLYTFWAVPFVREHALDISLLKGLDAFSTLIAGLFEEMLFRKLLMDSLGEAGIGVAWQIVLSALVFGALHAGWALFAKEKKSTIPAVLSTIALGAALAILYVAAGRIVFVPTIAHILINLAIEPWLILSSLGGNDDDRAD